MSLTERPPAPALEVQGLSHKYGSKLVLKDVSFEVARGEIFGFIGPNGAGKTTTIRAISTLLRPFDGRIRVCGIDIAEHPQQVRTLLGYMPDHAGVYPRLSVREYLEFFASAHGIDSPNITDAVLELTQMQTLQTSMVMTLSKGQKQRLQLARVLLHDPELLILDEPASDLDPRARVEMRDLLLELRELGKTILLSSHILTELSDVCTSVGIIERGQLLDWGPLHDISRRLGENQPTKTSPESPSETVPDTDLADAGKTAEPATDAASQVTQYTAGGTQVPEAAARRLRLKVLPESPNVPTLLSASAAVKEVQDLGGYQYLVHYTGDERLIAELVRYLTSHGVLLTAVEPKQNELERVFLELTNSPRRDS